MLKPLVFNSNDIYNYLNERDYSSLANYLKKTFTLERSPVGVPLQYELSVETLDVLHEILTKIIIEHINENNNNVLKELFRSLRNYVINPDVQSYLASDGNFLNNVEATINSQTLPQDTLEIILQFLINLIISNKTAADTVYQKFSKHLFLMLKHKIVVYEATALLYNVSLYQELCLDFHMYVCILELYQSSSQAEFVHFLIEKFISYQDFWTNYEKLDLCNRKLILEIIRDKQIKGETLNLPMQGLKALTNHFVSSGNVIFQTASSTESNSEPYEVSQLLQVISSLCGVEEYLNILQSDKDLLINCGVLLINIHRLGKESENYFSSIQKLAEIREPNKSIYEHPAFGFKADLIRIIGNLCWKNKIMQDLVREAELVPVILDCCNMDARNPFIMQWVILAVRNICEKNVENQKIIAELHQEGTVSSSVLEEMGLTLHNDGDKSLKVVPLDALRSQK